MNEKVVVEMTQDELKIVHEFMSRVDLKGAEVPAFARVLSLFNAALSKVQQAAGGPEPIGLDSKE